MGGAESGSSVQSPESVRKRGFDDPPGVATALELDVAQSHPQGPETSISSPCRSLVTLREPVVIRTCIGAPTPVWTSG